MVPTIIQSCPACSGTIRFMSETSTLIVCPVCRATLFKDADKGLRTVAQNIITDHLSTIQPGTTGSWEKKKFTVLGRIRCRFEEAVYNYWAIDLEQYNMALLAEGYGMYSILLPSKLPEVFPVLSDNTQHDSPVTLDGKRYLLEKKQQCLDWEMEGEAWIASPENKFRVFELAAPDGTRRTVFSFDKLRTAAFVAYHTKAGQLDLQHKRKYENAGHSFICSDCASTIYVKTFPFAQSCACPSCHTFYEYQQGKSFIRKKKAQDRGQQWIQLGTTGTIDGIAYEVIGYVQKEEANTYQAQWREYTLFNPVEGFAFLSEYNGHWMYVRETEDSPVLLEKNMETMRFEDNEYRLFNRYHHIVSTASGEFPYNIYDNSKTEAVEYIAPPLIWIKETDPAEGVKWYFGRHIEPATISEIFNANALPYREGVGAVQPTGHIPLFKWAVAAFAGLVLLMLLHGLMILTKKQTVLFDEEYEMSGEFRSVVTNKYHFPKARSNVRFDIYAPVSNCWFELDITMVNTNTGKEYSLQQGVEYYSGYDGGESWSEGKTNQVAYFSRVPAGDYLFQMTGERNSPVVSGFKVKATYDVPTHRNLYIAIILFMILPAVQYLISNRREVSRWSNSPFSDQGQNDEE